MHIYKHTRAHTHINTHVHIYILVQLFWSNSYIRDSKTDIVTIDLTTPNSIKTIQQLKCAYTLLRSGSRCAGFLQTDESTFRSQPGCSLWWRALWWTRRWHQSSGMSVWRLQEHKPALKDQRQLRWPLRNQTFPQNPRDWMPLFTPAPPSSLASHISA